MRHTGNTLIYIGLLALAACAQDCPAPQGNGEGRMEMRLTMEHPGATRATATAFEAGDRIGLYVVADSIKLSPADNLLNNVALTYTGTGQAWSSRYPLYWDKGSYNLYAYYPHTLSVKSVTDMPFAVSTDQSTPRSGSTPGGYEASDLLYAARKRVAATDEPVVLTFRHLMSHLTIRLIKGEDCEDDLPTNARVYVLGTVPEATIDLAYGEATKNPRVQERAIRARQRSDYVYEAIVVPQRIQYRTPLVEVEMGGISYVFEDIIHFKAGTDHLVNIVINEDPEKTEMNISGEVDKW